MNGHTRCSLVTVVQPCALPIYDAAFADAVAAAVERQIPELSTSAVARTSWDANGAIILVKTLKEALPLVDRLAPEHLELAVDDPQSLFEQVRHAGSIFMGRMTPEAVGEYVAGPNHVLPTGRRARFSSGLSVLDFMKRDRKSTRMTSSHICASLIPFSV